LKLLNKEARSVNIVVSMKQIPDLEQVRIRNRQPVFDDVPFTFGRIDKNALEAGVKLKETTDANVVIVSTGSEQLEDTVKEALAAGGDEAYLVVDDSLDQADSMVSAEILAEVIRGIENTGIILFGEGSGDNYSGQVGARTAQILGLPQIGYASHIETDGKTARITRVLENSEEVLEVDLPVVISVLADINEPRIPSVTQILKAGKKPKQILEIDGLDFVIRDSAVETISNLAPEIKRRRIEVKTAEELVKLIKAEGF
jgi:electron transfer flavoprotein beta subunit